VFKTASCNCAFDLIPDARNFGNLLIYFLFAFIALVGVVYSMSVGVSSRLFILCNILCNICIIVNLLLSTVISGKICRPANVMADSEGS